MKAYTIAYVPHEDDEDNIEYTLPCVFVGQALAQEHANAVASENPNPNDRGTWVVRDVLVYEELPQQISRFVLSGKIDPDGNVFDREFTEHKSWEYLPTGVPGSGYHNISKNFHSGLYYTFFSFSGDTPKACEQLLEQRKKQMLGDLHTKIENAQKAGLAKKKAAPVKIVLPNEF